MSWAPHRSVDSDLAQYFADPRVRLAFSFQSKYLGMSPYKCPSLFTILAFLEYEYGVFHPRGGCGAVMEAMARVANQLRRRPGFAKMQPERGLGLFDPARRRREPLLAPVRFDVASLQARAEDGTLAPITDAHDDARVPDATRETLRKLAGRYELVACVTGRRALEARRIVGVDELVYAGNHGFELLRPGAAEAVADPAVGSRAGRPKEFVEGLDQGAQAPRLDLRVAVEEEQQVRLSTAQSSVGGDGESLRVLGADDVHLGKFGFDGPRGAIFATIVDYPDFQVGNPSRGQ